MEQKLKKEGKIRDIEYLTKLYKNKRLYIAESPCTYLSLYELKEVIEACNFIYPDSWDFKIEIRNKNLLYIEGLLIYFDRVKIKNKIENAFHNIRDCFFHIPFVNKHCSIYFNFPTFIRTTFSHSEIQSYYIHSHCSRVNLVNERGERFFSFCTGNGPINDILRNDLTKKPFDRSNLSSLLLSLIPLVSWESLDTNPYTTFSSIGSSFVGHQYFVQALNLTYNLIEEFLNYVKDKRLTLPFKIDNNTLKIYDEEKVKELIINFIEEEDKYKNYLCFYNTSSNEWLKFGTQLINLIQERRNKIVYTDNTYVDFRGKRFHLTVEDEEDEEQTEQEISRIKPTLHITDFKRIIHKLNYEANTEETISKISQRKYQSIIDYFTKSTTTDQVPV